MPRVTSYGPRQVATAPLPGARRQAADATFESAGGTVANAQAGLGNVIARVGAGVAAEAFRQERDRADQVFQLSVKRQANDLDHLILRDPEKGILNKRGLAVMESRDDAIGQWDEQFGMIAAGAKTDRQRLIVEQERVGRRAALEDAIDRVGVAESRRHEDNEFTAFLGSSQQRAITNADNPHIVTDALGEQEAAIHDYAKRNGIGPETTQQLLESARNTTWSAAIVQNIADGKVAAAKTYFEEAKEAGLLTGEALTKMTDAVNRGVADAEGEAAAEEIWTAHGPPADDDTAAINLDKMETAARERFRGDVDTMKATIAALRTRKQGVDAGRDARQENVLSRLWGDVLAGKSYAEIARSQEAVSNPKVLLQVRDHLENQAYRDEQRAATREQRLFTREGRALQAEQRRQQQLESDAAAAYFELAQPERLRELQPGYIMAQLPILGNAHVNRLLQGLQQLRQNEAQLRQAEIDNDLFKDIATEALRFNAHALDAPSTPTGKTQRATLGKLLPAVNDVIAAATVKKGSALTGEEQRAEMQRIVDRKVMFDRFGYDVPGVAAAVANKDDQEQAYVPIAQIPPASIQAAVTLLRSKTTAFQGLTDEQIRTRAQRAIERAYAAKVMQLGPEEEQRRLLER